MRRTGMSDRRGAFPKKQKDDEKEKKGGLTYLRTLITSTTLARKDKNEPARFLGDGVSFKAKLIGILEVSEARGDRMCQEALADLKMAIRAAGEHKQRININIAIDGLRLRDEKTGDCLYHHPVHKISFIAQDMTDSRAFGYIFGSPDTGHRFFGIKTDKAASQVVITMRDLFQVVFELKKKEIEMAKQHIEQHQIKYTSTLFSDATNKTSIEPMKIRPITEDRKENACAVERADDNQEHIMDLLDLELELNNIQQGINQMDRITPSDPFGPPIASKVSSDPFGDSFNPLSSKNKIPPPPESGKRTKTGEKHWFDQETEALFEETDLPSSLSTLHSSAQPVFPLTSISGSPLPTDGSTEDVLRKLDASPPRDQFDVFTDLDPLGTGRSKPYIDKKDFFQDLKNPPKKVLKDLVIEVPADNKQTLFHGNYECDNSSSGQKNSTLDSRSTMLFTDSFPDDPFEKDPFLEVDFTKTGSTSSNDPFDKFADFTAFSSRREDVVVYPPECAPTKSAHFSAEVGKPTPLKVSLPPEKLGTSEGASALSPLHLRRTSRLQKANSLSCVISKPPSPKQKHRNKLLSQTSTDTFGDRNSPIMEGVTIKSRTIVYATTPESHYSVIVAPEPPPRSALNTLSMKPPPLPPKRIPAAASTKPPPRPPHSDYDYIENYQTTHFTDLTSPPLPAPARKPKSIGKLNSEPEYYLQPFPLLPPPKKKNYVKVTPVANEQPHISSKPTSSANKSLDITLSQLTKTGFSDLAATLNMSPTSLSKMTLQELTKCLASLSNESQNKEQCSGLASGENLNSEPDVLKSECYSTLQESIDEDTPSFKAEFEAHFSSSKDISKKEEESLFDKYAVFRELLEEEKKQTETIVDEPQIEDNEDTDINKFDNIIEVKQNEPPPVEKIEPPVEDRYAALRDICLDEVIEEKYEDLSDKEDSIIEPSRLEEDTDLLPQSRPHSESTESPTITMKEHQSIIEATIMEEDISTLDVDEEEVPEESIDETLKEQIETDTVVDSPMTRVAKFSGPLPFSPTEKFKPVCDKSNHEINASWAKFDTGHGHAEPYGYVHSDGHVSPWSNESKDNDLSPACRDKRKHRKVRRHKQTQWQEDEESEEGWNGRVERGSWSPSRRENGWSDGDSLYDETVTYIERDYSSPRRSRRRRVSPWNSREQSPWEEDDREATDDKWENSRYQEEVRQRPKHRGQSWEDERRRHYEEPRNSRNLILWTDSHNWEEGEMYQKRNYIERRRRKWDEDTHNRNRIWRDREWAEAGGKINNRYCKERGHDSHWEDEHGDDEHWAQRPRSCDRGRRQFSSGHHTSDSDFPDRRYIRSREGHCSDIDYRRKAQTLQRQKQRRKRSQTSPFEDDFSPQFGFSKESPGGPDAFDPESKKSPVPFDTHKKSSFNESVRPKDFSQYPSQPNTHTTQQEYTHEYTGSKVCRSYQQSPFEDDFTSSDNRRCSGRSASSDMSDPRGNDEVFYSGPNEGKKNIRSDIIKRPKSANQADSLSRNPRSFKNIPHSTESIAMSNQNKPLNHPECELSDIAQCMTDKKPNNTNVKGRVSNLKRSDSSSSLRKSESVNIFARNNDPFDDDFFSEESSSNHRNKDKSSKPTSQDSKWADSFNDFSFDEETK